VVTGGLGRLGRLVVGELLARGYDVLAVDLAVAKDPPCHCLPVDLTQAAAVHDALRGADAVVHLAAIPGPTSHPASVTFCNNVLSTWNVVEAAAALGARRLVFASSMFTLGWVEQAGLFWPRYVPVDEQHPCSPFEAYGLSKVVGEEICAAASRRTGLPIISLRIMNVVHPTAYSAFPWPAPTREQPVRFVMWPYVDARDAAAACRLALEADTAGHEAMFIAAAETRFARPTADLLRELGPADLETRGPLLDCATVVRLDRARQLIGYEPRHSWREAGSGGGR
jgi:nucleoside-diphosphate-sugar epimerase